MIPLLVHAPTLPLPPPLPLRATKVDLDAFEWVLDMESVFLWVVNNNPKVD